MWSVDDILREDERRQAEFSRRFDPITGEGSLGERELFELSDFPLPAQWLPREMMGVPLVRKLGECGSVASFLEREMHSVSAEDREKVIQLFVRLRCKYDFAFWAALYVYIKRKGGGEDVRFRLNHAQRKLVGEFERQRLSGKPIRVVLLKARQWGGSTATQIYMAWLQLVHEVGLNSLIVGHVKDSSTEVKDMFVRMLGRYPTSMLHEFGEEYDEGESKLVGVGETRNIQRIPQRNCKIKIGTAEKPDSARGGDYNLVHLTEVGVWKATDGKTPEDIVRSACSGVMYKPYTMIVYESTANGTGNFFQYEYDAAKEGKSQFSALFVSWCEIENNRQRVDDRRGFARRLLENRTNKNVSSEREESGAYLWWLWEQGATLDGINWYIGERTKHTSHAKMASECPSDDVEAFQHSGEKVFDVYNVAKLKGGCRPPRYVGEVYADGDSGAEALRDVRFREDSQGLLWIWAKPEIDEQERVTDRYLVVVDIGGRTRTADYSVILVLDRLLQMDGGEPTVVAQWYGHTDMDLLAWNAAQVASYYDNALLVIESNTIDTHDKERHVEGGDQSLFLLNQIKGYYDNLYAREQSEEDIREKRPVKYGFHTNTSTKPVIISTLIKVVREQLYIERDKRLLDELLTYEKKPNGAYGAQPGKHDDLLMTRAIGLYIAFAKMPLPRIVERHRQYVARPVTKSTI